MLFRATSLEGAIRNAEREARQYEKSLGGLKYLGFVEAYSLTADNVQSGTEVFSLMRSSSRTDKSYVTRYFDDGSEHRQR